jgi:hypothetical protein
MYEKFRQFTKGSLAKTVMRLLMIGRYMNNMVIQKTV